MRPISVGGSTIALSKTVKFLGVTLDNKLNYNTHIDNVTPKSDCCSHAMQESSGTYVRTLSQDVQVDLQNSDQTHIVLQRNSLGQSTIRTTSRNSKEFKH